MSLGVGERDGESVVEIVYQWRGPTVKPVPMRSVLRHGAVYFDAKQGGTELDTREKIQGMSFFARERESQGKPRASTRDDENQYLNFSFYVDWVPS